MSEVYEEISPPTWKEQLIINAAHFGGSLLCLSCMLMGLFGYKYVDFQDTVYTIVLCFSIIIATLYFIADLYVSDRVHPQYLRVKPIIQMLRSITMFYMILAAIAYSRMKINAIRYEYYLIWIIIHSSWILLFTITPIIVCML
jgi:hypothetical protein